MTVIAWDGKTLAADRMSSSSGSFMTTRKLQKINGHLVGGAGCSAQVRMHMAWYAAGADPSELPSVIASDDVPSLLLVISPEKRIFLYENGPLPTEFFDPFVAIGSGRDFALAAMHLGYDALMAVNVASRLSTSCGGGYNTLSFEEAP